MSNNLAFKNRISLKATLFSYFQGKVPRYGATIIIALSLLASSSVTNIGCSNSSDAPADEQIETATSEESGVKPTKILNSKCGDGICDEFEKGSGNCPEDCGTGSEIEQYGTSTKPNEEQTTEPVVEDEEYIREPGTVYFGFMVHLEGWFDEEDNEVKFYNHMRSAQELADVFEQYGAQVTFEASPETIEACGVWNNVLLELENRGHGIGVHADKGFSTNPSYNLKLFTAQIKEMKADAEALGLTIQHVSGTCSSLDWAKASIDAGYLFTTGGVGYCAMSMPEEIRPEEYKDCTNPALCHGNMPLDMEDRINPWRINTALGDWTIDNPDGGLVILASDGGIKNLYEESLDSSQTHGDMEYSDEDIDIVIEKVEEAISLSDANKTNIIYFSLSIGAADVDSSFYSKMFESLQTYVDAGQLEYKTMNEMYEEYISNL